MRIAILATTAVEFEGPGELGPPRTIRGLSAALSGLRNLDVIALVVKRRRQPPTETASGRLRVMRCWIGDLPRVIRNLEPEVLQTFSTTSHTPQGQLAARVARICGGKWVDTCLGLVEMEKRLGCNYSTLDCMYEKATVTSADHVVFPSTLAKSTAASIYGHTLRGKSSIIPLGIDEGLGGVETTRFIADGGGKSDQLHLVSIGAIAPHKGQDLLLRSFLKAKAFGDLQLVGPVLDPEFRDGLVRAASKMTPGKTVHFTGFIGHEAALRSIQSADLFCLFSRFDVFAQTVVEAMSIGRAPLITDTVGCAEVVTHMRSGYVAPLGDTDEAARLIDAIHSDARGHAERGVNARAVSAMLVWPRVATGYSELYRRILQDAS